MTKVWPIAMFGYYSREKRFPKATEGKATTQLFFSSNNIKMSKNVKKVLQAITLNKLSRHMVQSTNTHSAPNFKLYWKNWQKYCAQNLKNRGWLDNGYIYAISNVSGRHIDMKRMLSGQANVKQMESDIFNIAGQPMRNINILKWNMCIYVS